MRLAKSHPLFPAKLVVAVQMAGIEGFSAHSTRCMQLKTQNNFYGQGRLLKKGISNCQSQPLGTASLLHAPSGMETEQWLTVVCIPALATYTVSRG